MPAPMPTVDRCVCHQVLFRSMLPQIAALKADGTTNTNLILDHLRAHTKCTTNCGMCEPYIRRMIETGQASFALFDQPRNLS